MERRGRASDCQRSYDFTQNDLPPPLTGRRHTPDATSTARRLVQSGLTFGAAVLLFGPAMALLAPFSASSTRSSSSRVFHQGGSVRKPYPRRLPVLHLGSFRSNEPSARAWDRGPIFGRPVH